MKSKDQRKLDCANLQHITLTTLIEWTILVMVIIKWIISILGFANLAFPPGLIQVAKVSKA